MAQPLLKMEIRYIRDPRLLAKQANKFVRNGIRAVIREWWRGTLPKHFEQGAVSRYGYDKRTAKYMRKKAGAWGHQRPLVRKPGDPRGIERTMRQSISIKASGRGGRGGGDVRGIGRMRGPGRMEQQYKDETTFVTQDEASRMAQRLANLMRGFAKRFGKRSVTRLR